MHAEIRFLPESWEFTAVRPSIVARKVALVQIRAAGDRTTNGTAGK